MVANMASFPASSLRLAAATASSSRVRLSDAATKATSFSFQRALETGPNTSALTRRKHKQRSTWQPPTWLLPSIQLSTSRHFSSSASRTRPRTSTPSSSGKPEYSFPQHCNPTPYEIFHFTSTRNVIPSEVKSRYYDLVRSLHPDRLSTSSSDKTKVKAQEEFKLVVQAYNLLKDTKKKNLYDRAGIGWDGSKGDTCTTSPFAGSDPWRNWQDLRYTRRYNPGYTGPGHDRFGWQNQGFYSNQYNAAGTASYGNGWNGGNGKYTSNGILISTLFVVTWVLAGLQYSRLSLQSQKATERADRSHLDAAKSLNQARELARSQEGRERWKAFRRRAREQKVIEQLGSAEVGHVALLAIGTPKAGAFEESPYAIGHGGPSGKEAAQERFARAQQAQQARMGTQ